MEYVVGDNRGGIVESTRLETQEFRKESYLKWWILGIVFLIMSIVTLIVSPNKMYIRQKMTLSDGGEILNLWMTPNVDLFVKMYIFNITNKEGFLNGNEKLKLQEVGPFVYKLQCLYRNPVFNDEAGTVSINPELSLEWVPELNDRSEEDVLTLVNELMLAIASGQYDPFGVVKAALNQIIRQSRREPIENQSVRAFLFGEKQEFLQFLSNIMPSIKYDRYGLLTGPLDYKDEIHTFVTGQKDYEKGGSISNINNETILPYYEAPCNRLAGTSDGKKFGNNIDPKQELYVYNKLFCRSAGLAPSGPPTISGQGIPSVPYTFSDETLDNGQLNPVNKCFCVNNDCFPYGLMDISNCVMGYPFAMSFPHFYKGDPSLMHNIEGLNPNASLHSSKVMLNLETGMMTSLSLKLQANLYLKDQTSDTECCSKFSNMAIPFSWTEIGFQQLEPMIAFRIFLALRIFPGLEKISVALTFLAGLYFIFKAAMTNKIKYYKYSLRSNKSETTIIQKDYTPKENQITSFNDEADKQLKTLLTNDNEKQGHLI